MKFAFITLVFVSLTSVACNAQDIAIPKETLRYTRQLPAVDKVELQKVSGIERIEKVEATKVLTDKEALAVATLWREQTYGGTGAACHEPAYTIKFFSKEKLIVYAKNLVGFNAHGKKGQQLLRVFQNAFPQPNTEQKKN